MSQDNLSYSQAVPSDTKRFQWHDQMQVFIVCTMAGRVTVGNKACPYPSFSSRYIRIIHIYHVVWWLRLVVTGMLHRTFGNDGPHTQKSRPIIVAPSARLERYSTANEKDLKFWWWQWHADTQRCQWIILRGPKLLLLVLRVDLSKKQDTHI